MHALKQHRLSENYFPICYDFLLSGYRRTLSDTNLESGSKKTGSNHWIFFILKKDKKIKRKKKRPKTSQSFNLVILGRDRRIWPKTYFLLSGHTDSNLLPASPPPPSPPPPHAPYCSCSSSSVDCRRYNACACRDAGEVISRAWTGSTCCQQAVGKHTSSDPRLYSATAEGRKTSGIVGYESVKTA